MPTLVEVDIKGLALCYRTHTEWNVYFVCDPTHKLWLTEPKRKNPVLRFQGHDFTCTFDGQFTPGPLANYPPELLNLNGPQAHNGRLRKNRRNCLNTSTVHLSLPASARISVVNTNPDYYIEEVRGAGPQAVNHPVATLLRFKFEIVSGDMSVRVGNNHRTPYDESFPDSGNTLKFQFDNECKASDPCLRNDSLDLYELVHDPTALGERRFVTGQKNVGGTHVPGHNAGPHCPRKKGFLDKLWEVFSPAPAPPSPPYGNCDPMGSEPGPDD